MARKYDKYGTHLTRELRGIAGTVLAELRRDAGLTQSHISEQLQVQVMSVQSWEGGNFFPSTDNLTAYLQCVGTDERTFWQEVERRRTPYPELFLGSDS